MIYGTIELGFNLLQIKSNWQCDFIPTVILSRNDKAM